MNRQLSEENLMLKKQIKELKLKNNINNDKEKDKEIYKKTESDIDSYYTRVEELINELNDIMNKIEKKQSQNKINGKQENNNIKIKNINNEMNNIKDELENKKEDNENILNKLLQKKDNNKINPQSNINKIKEEKKVEEEKININNNNIKNEKQKQKKLEPIPYMEIPAEPSEREKETSEENSHFEDEEGNIYNYDDLTNEEKMLIIQQKIILQKLQEEAEARGEQFNPQEYIEFLERQALEEEEEEDEDIVKGKGNNKLNKSF